jgi:threonine-phosphate decarboxylase
MIIGHGGNIHEMAAKLGCAPSDIIDMSSNLNPWGPPEGLLDYLKTHMNVALALPEADAGGMTAAMATHYDIERNRVLAANGSTQFIYMIPQALNTRRALIVAPTYADYADACRMHEIDFSFFMTTEDDFKPDLDALSNAAKDCDTVFFCNPNNPTGVFTAPDRLEALCRSLPETRFIIDESYLPFVEDGEQQSMVQRNLPNVLVLNSMSKMFRLPGLRIGFLIASPDMVPHFQKYMLPWSVNALAQQAVLYLMMHPRKIKVFVNKTRHRIQAERQFVVNGLASAENLRLFPSTTTFILARLSTPLTAETVFEQMAGHRILIRNCHNFEGLSNQFIRFSLKQHSENQQLVTHLTHILNDFTLTP